LDWIGLVIGLLFVCLSGLFEFAIKQKSSGNFRCFLSNLGGAIN
jgi:hypothetical protein